MGKKRRDEGIGEEEQITEDSKEKRGNVGGREETRSGVKKREEVKGNTKACTSQKVATSFPNNSKPTFYFSFFQKLEFTLTTAGPKQNSSSSREHSAQIQEELRDIILKRKARNEDVFTWIDVSESGCSLVNSGYQVQTNS